MIFHYQKLLGELWGISYREQKAAVTEIFQIN